MQPFGKPPVRVLFAGRLPKTLDYLAGLYGVFVPNSRENQITCLNIKERETIGWPIFTELRNQRLSVPSRLIPGKRVC
jgi:hypothetical protein